MKRAFFVSLLSLCLVFALTLSANAALNVLINADEDFEGTTIFADQNWPINTRQVMNSSGGLDKDFIPDPNKLALHGVNIAYGDGDATKTVPYVYPHTDIVLDPNPPNPSLDNTGKATVQRRFAGNKSLKLFNGQKVAMHGSKYHKRDRASMIQFAVGFTTAPLTAGQVLGHFQLSYTTDVFEVPEDWNAEVNYRLDFVANKDNPSIIDIYSRNTSTTLASVPAQVGKWANITLLNQMKCIWNYDLGGGTYNEDPETFVKEDLTTFTWGAKDYTNDALKGPQDFTGEDYTANYASGVTVFVNSNAPAEHMGISQLDPTGAWGNTDNITVDENGSAEGGVLYDNDGLPDTTAVAGWEIAAEGEAAIFVDDLYYGDIPGKSTDSDDPYQEIAARINAFDQTAVSGDGSYQPEDIDAGASNWYLY